MKKTQLAFILFLFWHAICSWFECLTSASCPITSTGVLGTGPPHITPIPCNGYADASRTVTLFSVFLGGTVFF